MANYWTLFEFICGQMWWKEKKYEQTNWNQ